MRDRVPRCGAELTHLAASRSARAGRCGRKARLARPSGRGAESAAVRAGRAGDSKPKRGPTTGPGRQRLRTSFMTTPTRPAPAPRRATAVCSVPPCSCRRLAPALVACGGELGSGDPECPRDASDVQAGSVREAVGDQRGARVAHRVVVGVGALKLAAEHIPGVCAHVDHETSAPGRPRGGGRALARARTAGARRPRRGGLGR